MVSEKKSLTTGVSVVICCYNSEKRITKTLKHLSKQKLPDDISLEIILVDNASKDQTILTAKEAWNRLDVSKAVFKVVVEERPGLSYARKKGMQTAKFDYVLFCDDDNWLGQDYIFNSFQFLTQNSDYAIVGGNGIAVCEIEPPKWFDSFKSMYATGCRKNGEVTNVYGAGMCVRKVLLTDFSSIMTDRVGNSLISGGDSEMCYYLRSKGYKIRQLCFNKFEHFIPKERLTSKYLYRMGAGRGQSMALLDILKAGSKKNIGIVYRFKNHLNKGLRALRSLNKYFIIYEFNYIRSYWAVIISS